MGHGRQQHAGLLFRDPLRFPDLNHAIKRDPRTGLRSADSNWDFWTLLPEALHQVTIVMSDRGIPKSLRHMHGFGSHTYSMINADNDRVWVKFHFRTQQGIDNLSDAESATLIADDRESHGRDLLDAIDGGNFPKWTLFIQVMTEEQARVHKHNPFDLTKVWPKGDYPLIEVGEMELNRYPDNFFAEVEQAAFSPSNIVPGIGFSPDKMLQARLFSYPDAARYRLGVNHNHIPVNAPRCPYHSYHRDGPMRTDGNLGGTPSYWPNSKGEWMGDDPALAEPPLALEGAAAHWDHRVDEDHYEQPGNLFRLMSPEQQQLLFDNTARAMGDARDEVKRRHVENCTRADPAYGAGVAKAPRLVICGGRQISGGDGSRPPLPSVLARQARLPRLLRTLGSKRRRGHFAIEPLASAESPDISISYVTLQPVGSLTSSLMRCLPPAVSGALLNLRMIARFAPI